MDPAVWRKKAGRSLRDLAEKCDCTWSSIRRWERGESEAVNSVVLAYERESKGEVTGADFNRVRKRWMREHEQGRRTAA